MTFGANYMILYKFQILLQGNVNLVQFDSYIINYFKNANDIIINFTVFQLE